MEQHQKHPKPKRPEVKKRDETPKKTGGYQGESSIGKGTGSTRGLSTKKKGSLTSNTETLRGNTERRANWTLSPEILPALLGK